VREKFYNNNDNKKRECGSELHKNRNATVHIGSKSYSKVEASKERWNISEWRIFTCGFALTEHSSRNEQSFERKRKKKKKKK
jgi:hypothetical protein